MSVQNAIRSSKTMQSLCVIHFLRLKLELWPKKSPSESFNSFQVKPGQIVEISKLRDKPKVMTLINTVNLSGVEILPPN